VTRYRRHAPAPPSVFVDAVSVESEVGKGTTFTVQIPAVYREI
jgi:hypothetical protein